MLAMATSMQLYYHCVELMSYDERLGLGSIWILESGCKRAGYQLVVAVFHCLLANLILFDLQLGYTLFNPRTCVNECTSQGKRSACRCRAKIELSPRWLL